MIISDPRARRALLAAGVCMAALAGSRPALADEAAQNEIVVTAAGYEQKVTDAPASISVITAEVIKQRPYTTLIDAVRDLEGVDVGETTDKTGQRTISIRGMGSDYTLILIDGKRQNNHGDIYPNSFGGNQFNHIPPLDTIERIEVIRGPASTLYGADALGGVINIITKRVAERWTGSATLGRTIQERGEFGDDTTLDVALRGPIIPGHLGLALRGSVYWRNASNPQFDAAVDPDGGIHPRALGFGGGGRTVDNTNKSAGGTLTWALGSDHSLMFDLDYSRQVYDNTPTIDAATGTTSFPLGTLDSIDTIWLANAAGMVQPRVGYTEDQVFDRLNWAVTHQGDWGFGKSFVSLAYIATSNEGRTLPFSVAERLALQDLWNAACGAIGASPRCRGTAQGAYRPPTPDDLNPAQRAQLEAFLPRPARQLESNQYTLDARLDIPVEGFAGRHRFIVGGQWINGKLEDGVFGLEASEGGIEAVQDQKQWSLFAEDNWTPIEPLTITAGIRYDRHQLFGGRFSPRLYAVLTPTSTLTIKGGVSTGFKTPRTTDLYDGIRGFGGQGTSPMIGNPLLKPETSVNSEVAVYWNPTETSGINVTLFQNDFRDKVASTTVQPCAVTGFVRPCANLGPYFDVLGLGGTISQPVNIDKARIRGVEVAGRYEIFSGLAIRANYTMTDSEQLSGAEEGQPLTQTARHMANATVDWRVTDKLSTQLMAEVRSRRYRGVDGLTGNFLYFRGYEVLHLGAQYRLNDFLTIGGRVNNLLNQDFTSYDTDFTRVDGEWQASFQDHYNNKDRARSYWININARF
jgi:outer membrane receptor for ferrienterochelin and colicins